MGQEEMRGKEGWLEGMAARDGNAAWWLHLERGARGGGGGGRGL